MASPGLTFRDMIDEVITFRFSSAQESYVKRWLNIREQYVYALSEWPFKKRIGVHMTINQGDNYLDLPGTIRRVENIYDEAGMPLVWYPPDEFAARNRGNTTAGHPVEYTLSGNQIVLSPPAAGDTEYTIDYEQGLYHYNNSDTRVSGPMTIDSDYPAWLSSYFWILVSGAMATGLKMENDPTYAPLEQEFLTGLEAMKEELLPPSHAATLQYGRDTLG